MFLTYIVTGGCPNGWKSFSDHCYLFVYKQITWMNAGVSELYIFIQEYDLVYCKFVYQTENKIRGGGLVGLGSLIFLLMFKRLSAFA